MEIKRYFILLVLFFCTRDCPHPPPLVFLASSRHRRQLQQSVKHLVGLLYRGEAQPDASAERGRERQLLQATLELIAAVVGLSTGGEPTGQREGRAADRSPASCWDPGGVFCGACAGRSSQSAIGHTMNSSEEPTRERVISPSMSLGESEFAFFLRVGDPFSEA